MKTLVSAAIFATLAAGCIWDKASVEPRTEIRMNRTGSEPNVVTNAAAAPGATMQTNGLAVDPIGFGVAPYLSQTTSGTTGTENSSANGNSATGATGPATGPGGTGGTSGTAASTASASGSTVGGVTGS